MLLSNVVTALDYEKRDGRDQCRSQEVPRWRGDVAGRLGQPRGDKRGASAEESAIGVLNENAKTVARTRAGIRSAISAFTEGEKNPQVVTRANNSRKKTGVDAPGEKRKNAGIVMQPAMGAPKSRLRRSSRSDTCPQKGIWSRVLVAHDVVACGTGHGLLLKKVVWCFSGWRSGTIVVKTACGLHAEAAGIDKVGEEFSPVPGQVRVVVRKVVPLDV